VVFGQPFLLMDQVHSSFHPRVGGWDLQLCWGDGDQLSLPARRHTGTSTHFSEVSVWKLLGKLMIVIRCACRVDENHLFGLCKRCFLVVDQRRDIKVDSLLQWP
jgi:hypothetical protein